jgi:chemotaxis protein methyltransferase CheR
VSSALKKPTATDLQTLDSQLTLDQEKLVKRVSDIVQQKTGVQLGVNRKAMVNSRIYRRMAKLGVKSPAEYLEYLEKNEVLEIDALVSLLTTHHTHFFREFQHFEFLSQTAIPKIVEKIRAANKTKKIKIWCAAASRGQEIYSLAMYLNFHLPLIAPDFEFEIFGSDVDFESVKVGKNGVYPWDELKEAPATYLAEHWVKGTGEIANYVKAADTLKKKCSWGVVNLIDPDFTGIKSGLFDIVFCRNVFIYFTPEQIEKISTKLLTRMESWGYLFVGLSESLLQLKAPLQYVGPSIYVPRLPENTTIKETPKAIAAKTVQTPMPAPTPIVNLVPEIVRVLCIDDSPTVLSILKNVFKKETGFEVAGTAKNGVEAVEWLKKNKCDVVTLDLQMPIMGGLEYLKTYFTAKHPPVLVVSSMSREDSEGGIKALEYGAVDYVEKPTLQNLGEKSEEIRFKLKTAFLAKMRKDNPTQSLQKIEAQLIKKNHVFNASKTLRVVLSGLGEREKIKSLLQELTDKDAPTVFLFEANAALVAPFEQDFKKFSKLDVELFDKNCQPQFDPKSSKVFVGNQEKDLNALLNAFGNRAVSICILGEISPKLSGMVLAKVKDFELILEDLGDASSQDHKKLLAKAEHIVPYTSFIYHSSDYLGAKSVVGQKV